jgi:hypothetical protein
MPDPNPPRLVAGQTQRARARPTGWARLNVLRSNPQGVKDRLMNKKQLWYLDLMRLSLLMNFLNFEEELDQREFYLRRKGWIDCQLLASLQD